MPNHVNLAKRAAEALASAAKKSTLFDHEVLNVFYKRFSKSSLYSLPMLSRHAVDKTVIEMENDGYEFGRREGAVSRAYSMSIEDVRAIYRKIGIDPLSKKYAKAITLFMGNLKGGVSKTVSSVSVSHALRTHPKLMMHDIRVLIIDLDPQASATMFCNHNAASADIQNTTAQAMLSNLTKEEILTEFIVKSNIDGVDLIPSSINDAFIASKWPELCAEHLPGQNINSVLKDCIIDKISDSYDFIIVDTGPHLDYFLNNCLQAADIMFTPIPPARVDFDSTMKYLMGLPSIFSLIEDSGATINKDKHNVGYMSKLAKKADHQDSYDSAKSVFGGDMLDAYLPRLDAFERCGETFNSVISVSPADYNGSKESLAKGKEAAYKFAKSLFDRVEFIRENEGA